MKLPELPPLPEPDFENHDNGDVFGCEKTYFLTPAQIQAYATTYAEAAVKAEREACAQLVASNHLVSGGIGPSWSAGFETALECCASAIRARSKE